MVTENKRLQSQKKINNKESLIEQILNSDLIVGCETMAMIVGVIAKKRVISIIPPGGKKCSLPHREIEHLQAIKKKIENIHSFNCRLIILSKTIINPIGVSGYKQIRNKL